MSFPFQHGEWCNTESPLHENEVNEHQNDLEEIEEHHARETYELTHSNTEDHHNALILQQGFAQNTTLALYFHTCLIGNPKVWAQIQFTRTSINQMRRLIQLSKMCEEFDVPCPIQPETVLARTFCRRIQQRLDFTGVASGVDYESPHLFPPRFREEAYW